jgi:GntR family transcriptional regulator
MSPARLPGRPEPAARLYKLVIATRPRARVGHNDRMGAGTDPVYLRVLEDLRAQILGGVLEPGARVPSRNGIIARYGVGETAAKHALQVLATEGLIEARAGSGSYVRRVPALSCLEHDRPHFPGSPFGLVDERAVVAWEHRTQRVHPPRQVARRLGLAENHLVNRTRYLLTADGSPVQLATSYEPAEVTSGTAVAFPEEGPLAGRGVVERMRAIGVRVDQLIEDVCVRPCPSEEASALGVAAGAPVLVVTREHRAGQRAVETSEIVISADRFTLRYRIPVARAGEGTLTPVPAAAAGATAAGAGMPA